MDGVPFLRGKEGFVDVGSGGEGCFFGCDLRYRKKGKSVHTRWSSLEKKDCPPETRGREGGKLEKAE